MSIVTALEVTLVLIGRKGLAGEAKFQHFLLTSHIELAPFDASQYHAAVTAYKHFGKGRHPAGLNFGDCTSYGLAKVKQLPLLY